MGIATININFRVHIWLELKKNNLVGSFDNLTINPSNAIPGICHEQNLPRLLDPN